MWEIPQARRAPAWLIAGTTLLVLWLLFGPSAAGDAYISPWSGDAGAKPPAADIAPQQPPNALRGVFNAAGTADIRVSARLAADPHLADEPWGNPTDSDRAVITQGYGVGSHAPAAIWGGVDIAIDGDGNGEADPSGSWDAPVYATIGGVVELEPDSVPAGNHIWIKNEHWKVGFGHLNGFAVQNGQQVKRGDLIGYIGSSGQSSGPHLHYHVWRDGVNVDPLAFGALP